MASFSPLAASAAAGIVDGPKPLIVKMVGPEAKTKIKVNKRLVVLASCSKDCSIRARVTLVLPAVTDSGLITGGLAAGRVRGLVYSLTNSGLNYLKDNYRSSKLKVKFTGKDLETGKKVVKTRSFGFYR